MQAGLVDGSKIFMDSSLVQADAFNNSVVNKESLKRYLNKNYHILELRLDQEQQCFGNDEQAKSVIALPAKLGLGQAASATAMPNSIHMKNLTATRKVRSVLFMVMVPLIHVRFPNVYPVTPMGAGFQVKQLILFFIPALAIIMLYFAENS